jgi:hypothetical protein
VQRERAENPDYTSNLSAREWCGADPGPPQTVIVTVPVLLRTTSCCAAPGTHDRLFCRLAAQEAKARFDLPQREFDMSGFGSQSTIISSN